ncbi:hypothetical protein [Mycetocola tolaasinivorans]|uniref:hypothetical protein n=1 Tax=Mycetocola tolaasinivorans TaxID=76635 RepID=UPI0011C39E24|nr:hypothetical protein [Mycetocola tolaasinivorans]
MIIAGRIGSVADHLSASAELADSQGDETESLLHLAADSTLFRPVVEGRVENIWVLDGSDPAQRISRAVDIAKIEYVQGLKLVRNLAKAGLGDDKTAQAMAALKLIIQASAQAIGLDPDEYLEERTIDPSAITKKPPIESPAILCAHSGFGRSPQRTRTGS